MNRETEESFCAYVQGAVANLPPFTTLPAGRSMSYYTSGEKEKFKLPCVSFEMVESAALHAGTQVSRGMMTVWVETQADDESEEIHGQRVKAVERALRNAPAATAAITLLNKIRLFGYAVEGSSTELKDRHWTSGIDLSVGFGPPRPQF